jgi:uncharacterized MnhB-related membrane protein
MAYVLLGVGILICAILAILSRRLLISAIWLAVTSALVAVMIYLLGAPHIAVIELSVGAGLVTVLFVFAINIAGEDTAKLKSLLPKPLAIGSIVLASALAIYLILHLAGIINLTQITASESMILWQERYADFLLQIVLIFSGVLGVLGLLANKTHTPDIEEHS